MSDDETIDFLFAVALAGQVSAGLTPGENQEQRAIAALGAIGLMLRNASDDPLIGEILAMSEHGHVTVSGPVTEFRWDKPES